MKQRLSLIALAKAGKAPAEIRLFKFGPNETTKGTFILDEAGAKDCLAKFKAYGNALAIDYEHQTFDASSNGAVPAAGWVEQGGLTIKSDGLWATVAWNADAKALIESKQLRYYSPTFMTDDANRVIEILPIAVTNYPATIGMPSLLARALSNRRKTTMLKTISLKFVSLAAAMDAAQAAVAAKFGETAEVVDVTDAEITYTADGKTFVVAYTVDEASGEIAFSGEPAEKASEAASAAAPAPGAPPVATKRVGIVTAAAFNALAAQVAGLQTQLAQKDDINAIVASMRKAKSWTPAREDRIKRVAASMSIKDARETANDFAPGSGVKLSNEGEGETREPAVVISADEKPYDKMTSMERAALAKSDPKKFEALRRASQRHAS